MAAEMSASALRAVCAEHKGYRTPALNDALYCNHKGFARLANLEPYTGLKALYLEGNALRSFDGLPLLADLKCMYAQHNCLTSLEGLANAPNLVTLNVSGNCLASLAGVEACAQLSTLAAERNNLESPAALAPLAACAGLHTLDLQHNNIADAPALLALLPGLPALRCLYLRGNPVVGRIPSYRKALITALPGLTYLDDRPVFPEERRCAEAWSRGGMEEERAERQRVRDEEDAQRKKNFDWLQELRRAGFRKRREMLGLPPGDTDPILDGMSDTEPDLEEPQDLADARARLVALVASQGGAPADDTGAPQAASGAGGCDQAAAAAAEDARDYFSSVREQQAALDAGGPPREQPAQAQGAGAPELWRPDSCAVARLQAVQAAGAAALAAIGGGAVAGEVARDEATDPARAQLVPALVITTAREDERGKADWGSAEPSQVALGACAGSRAELRSTHGSDGEGAAPSEVPAAPAVPAVPALVVRGAEVAVAGDGGDVVALDDVFVAGCGEAVGTGREGAHCDAAAAASACCVQGLGASASPVDLGALD